MVLIFNNYQIILDNLKHLNGLFNVQNGPIFLDFDFELDSSRDLENEWSQVYFCCVNHPSDR